MIVDLDCAVIITSLILNSDSGTLPWERQELPQSICMLNEIDDFLRHPRRRRSVPDVASFENITNTETHSIQVLPRRNKTTLLQYPAIH